MTRQDSSPGNARLPGKAMIYCGVFLSIIGLVAAFCSEVCAAQALTGQGHEAVFSHSRIRLTGDAASGVAGVEIHLKPGWKTYWRSPGESGLAPAFDWSGSVNLADVEVLWPLPRRYRDPGGDVIGYKDAVLLPLRITPADRLRPINLRLEMVYAVCREICLPVEARLALSLSPSGQSGPDLMRILRAMAGLPEKPTANWRITRLAVREGDGAAVLELDLTGAAGGGQTAQIFIDAGEAVSVAPARLIAENNAENRQSYALPVRSGQTPAQLIGRSAHVALRVNGRSLAQDLIIR